MFFDDDSTWPPSFSVLSRPNLNLNSSDLRGSRCLRRLEVKFQRFLHVVESFLFALTLAGHVDFEALRDIPLPLTPDGSCERSLHCNILSHDGRFGTPTEPVRCSVPSSAPRLAINVRFCCFRAKWRRNLRQGNTSTVAIRLKLLPSSGAIMVRTLCLGLGSSIRSEITPTA
jgi:hypothetical protein